MNQHNDLKDKKAVSEYASNTPAGTSDYWRSPDQVWQYWNRRYNFTLDAAASDINHLTPDYYTEENSGLENEWFDAGHKRVWINPPYSNILPWIEKSIKEREKGCITLACLPADFTTEWAALAIEAGANLIILTGGKQRRTNKKSVNTKFMGGRIQFKHDGRKGSTNTKGTVFFEFHPTRKGNVKFISRAEIWAEYVPPAAE